MNIAEVQVKLTHIIAMAVATSTLSAAAFAAATDATVTPVQKAQIESVIRSYLVQNPEVVVASLQAYQQKQMDQVKKNVQKTQENAPKYTDILFKNASDPIAGNPSGTVTVVEFFDYQCPHCVDMEGVIANLIKTNPHLRVVYKDFPIRGPVSEFAAKASLAANKQGKYLQLHTELMKNADHLTTDGILNSAKNVGLNVDQLKTDMNDPEIGKQIKTTYKLAQDLGLLGTPAVFVGRTDIKPNAPATSVGFIPGQADQAQLQSLIDKNKG